MSKIRARKIFDFIHIFDKKYLYKHEKIRESFLSNHYLFHQTLFG